MSNDELLASLLEAVRGEGAAIARVVALLIKVEDRRLHLELSCSNIFDFCRRHLGFSEDEAYRRKETALLARRFPQILDALAARRVHMTALLLLRDVLTEENVETLMKAASGKSKSQIQSLVAEHSPQPDVLSSIRKLPNSRGPVVTCPPTHKPPTVTVTVPSNGEIPIAPDEEPTLFGVAAASIFAYEPLAASNATFAESVIPRAAIAVRVQPPREPARIRPSAQIEPLSTTRHRVQFTVSTEQRERLERARALTRHSNIDGDLAVVVDQAIALVIAKREKEKFAATKRPPSNAQSLAKSDRQQRTTSPTPNSTSNSATPARATEQASRPASRPDSPVAPAAPSVRAVPAATKREVVRRHGEQCSFVSGSGDRCAARELLELDHRHPRALGGSNDASNLRLLCRAHNQFAAERIFGRDYMARAIAKRRAKSERAVSPPSADEPERSNAEQPGLPFA